MAKLNIKKGDKVLIITGKESGKTGEVLGCFPEENKVVVKGMNIVVKHKKPRSAQDKGGINKQEGKLPVSNVMVVCPSCDKATRVKITLDEKGNRVRACKHCSAVLDNAKKGKKASKSETKTAKVETPVEKSAPKKETKEIKENQTNKAETKVAKTTEKKVEAKVEKVAEKKAEPKKETPAKATTKKVTAKSEK